LPPGSSRDQLENAMKGHILARGELMEISKIDRQENILSIAVD